MEQRKAQPATTIQRVIRGRIGRVREKNNS
jgi:hypothetical protein